MFFGFGKKKAPRPEKRGKSGREDEQDEEDEDDELVAIYEEEEGEGEE